VVCLGKLQSQLTEVLVIEEIDGVEVTNLPRQPKAEPAKEATEDWAAETLYEDDLVLGDLDSDDEVPSPEPSYPSGRMAARRRMQARAQQCIVCMEEKEHTFVPPHLQGCDSHVDGHRFCSDCWIDFLDHGLSVLRRGVTPTPLSCPICRSCIHVPDVWTVDVELPAAWTGSSKSSDAEVECYEVQVLTPTSENSAGAAEFSWVSSDSAASTDDCADSAQNGTFFPPLCRRVWDVAVRSSTAALRGVLAAASEATREGNGFLDVNSINHS
ncbi:unnamed protein product, partial [Symbiodinium sp. CCMP2456]